MMQCKKTVYTYTLSIQEYSLKSRLYREKFGSVQMSIRRFSPSAGSTSNPSVPKFMHKYAPVELSF